MANVLKVQALDPTSFEMTETPAHLSHYLKVSIRYIPIDAAGKTGTPMKCSTATKAHIFSVSGCSLWQFVKLRH